MSRSCRPVMLSILLVLAPASKRHGCPAWIDGCLLECCHVDLDFDALTECWRCRMWCRGIAVLEQYCDIGRVESYGKWSDSGYHFILVVAVVVGTRRERELLGSSGLAPSEPYPRLVSLTLSLAADLVGCCSLHRTNEAQTHHRSGIVLVSSWNRRTTTERQ